MAFGRNWIKSHNFAAIPNTTKRILYPVPRLDGTLREFADSRKMKPDEKHLAAEKEAFADALTNFVKGLCEYVSAEDGQWTVKGFIDIFKNIYTISSDTKIVSKILEIHLFPRILQFAQDRGYSIVLAEHQNWYPDLSFVKKDNQAVKFAVDLKTTYRDPEFPGHVNGFTLGSHGAYFRDRSSSKNIQFPYATYSGHFCLGIIYTRVDSIALDETEVIRAQELEDSSVDTKSRRYRVTAVENLRSIASVVRDFQFFVCEKWRLASDRQGSGNTANIGSITWIEDILSGNGIFAKLGEEWFDEYWMNYGVTTMIKKRKATPIRNLKDFLVFKGIDKGEVIPIKSKKKSADKAEECE